MVNLYSHKTLISKEMQYFIFLIENYANHKHISGATALSLWQSKGLAKKILSLYSPYHMLSLDYVCNDIDAWLQEQ